jgi:hypothetical protein
MVVSDQSRGKFVTAFVNQFHQAFDIPGRIYHCHLHCPAGTYQVGKILHRAYLDLIDNKFTIGFITQIVRFVRHTSPDSRRFAKKK